MKIPYFSVIIPTYNREKFIEKAISSVLKQTFHDFELIIIDDGSDDQTFTLINKFSDKRLTYIRQHNKGVSAARNRGIGLAKGKMIAFLDSDDYFSPQKLQVASKYIDTFPNYSIFHTEEIWYRNGELLNQKKIHQKPDDNVFENALPLCCISISTAVINKRIFDEIGTFDEKMPACEDYDFWLRATALYPVKLITEALTVKAGGHPDQLSKKFPAMDSFRIYAINKLIESSTLNNTQRNAAIKELKRKCWIYIQGAQKRNKTREINYFTHLMRKYKVNEGK